MARLNTKQCGVNKEAVAKESVQHELDADLIYSYSY